MTRRGRLSIVGALALLVILATWIVERGPSASGDAVAALPPEPAVAAAPKALLPPPRELLERLPVSRDALDLRVASATGADLGRVAQADASGRLYEFVPIDEATTGFASPVRVEYTLDADLTRGVFRALERGRVGLGTVVLMDTATGRVLAYASTDPGHFPPTRHYPAASLVKVITAAAALDTAPQAANLPCRFDGSPYRLTPARIDPPRVGNTVSLRRALATSNNQCFAQLAVHAIGRELLLAAISRFGWLDSPAPAHAAGTADPGEGRFEFGKMGCGLAGARITPLHAAQLAATLAHGELVPPRWIERIVDAKGRELPLSDPIAPRRVISNEIAAELRDMLVETTRSGTARRAFRKRNGTPLLAPVNVAGKTGSLSGKDPSGRYEWFIGAAPAEDPRIAVAVVVVQNDLWWQTASQIGAEVLRVVFCSDGPCRASEAGRRLGLPEEATAARGDESATRIN